MTTRERVQGRTLAARLDEQSATRFAWVNMREGRLATSDCREPAGAYYCGSPSCLACSAVSKKAEMTMS